MRKKESIFRKWWLAGLLLIFSTNMTLASSIQNTLQAPPEGPIHMDDTQAVWMSYQSGNWDVYHLNLASGVQSQITQDPNTQSYPQVWKNYIVWQDNRNHIQDGTGHFDIYLYNMNTKTETKISNIEGDHQSPIIVSNQILWISHKGKDREVMLYDIEKATAKRISSEGAQAFGIVCDGNIAAWMDNRGGNFNIYMYDIAKGQEKQLTYGLGDEVDPVVAGGKVVWMVAYNGVSQVYMYDTQDGLTTKLTAGKEDHRPIAFNGESLLLVEGDALALQNVHDTTQISIQSPTKGIPKQAFLAGDQVVWFNGKSIVSEGVKEAEDRKPEEVKEPEESPTEHKPVETAPGSGNSQTESTNGNTNTSGSTVQDKAELQAGKKHLIQANEDTVAASEDGKMSLTIKKGSFNQDVYITLSQRPAANQNNYEYYTPVYTWKIEGNKTPIQPMELRIDYSTLNIKNNPKKLWLYQIKENTLQPMTGKREPQAKALVSQVQESGQAAVLAYNKTFKDMQKHWAYEVVDTISSRHIINGYEDATFKPDQNITRAEFVKILVSSMQQQKQAFRPSIFKDVTSKHWALSYINAAYEKGWITGDRQGSFQPDARITREEMITILMRVDGKANQSQDVQNTALQKYRDSQSISQWAKAYMEKAVEQGLIQGSNQKLNPKSNATRAEAAALLYRYLDKLNQL